MVEATFDNNTISLASTFVFAKLVVKYGPNFSSEYTFDNINSKTYSITNTDLELEDINNIYYQIELIDSMENTLESTGIYNLEVINNTPAYKIYDVQDFKNDLDNLNFYFNLLQRHTTDKNFVVANEFFDETVNFLQNDLNANNLNNFIDGESGN